jgi:hypothetical protein
VSRDGIEAEVHRYIALRDRWDRLKDDDRRHLVDLLGACGERFTELRDDVGVNLVVEGLRKLPSMQSEGRPGGTACDPAVHNAIKADDNRWNAETQPYEGQVERSVVDGGDVWLESARCVHCKGGISRQVAVKLEPRT